MELKAFTPAKPTIRSHHWTLFLRLALPLVLQAPAAAAPDPLPVVIEPADIPRPPFTFTPEDDRFLEEVQHASFGYLWSAGDPRTGMVPDRSSVTKVSVAGVGFQLSAIPIGVERGWITREDASARTLGILRALDAAPDNRKAGCFYHYLDGATAGITDRGYEQVVSTIDSAILFAGMLTASSYFGGEVAALADAMFERANWRFFLVGAEEPKPFERGWISLGWKPKDPAAPTAEGSLLPFYWADAGDEQRLVTFLAVCAPRDEHRIDAKVYYRLRRSLGTHPGVGIVPYFPWSGALFTSFFAHCWIDYASLGTDNPAAQGVERRPRIDWWSASRRTVLMHRDKARQSPHEHVRTSPHMWGLTAMDNAQGYAVPGAFPTKLVIPGQLPDVDEPSKLPSDDQGDGTVAPYGPGCSIMFDPDAAIAALRHFRSLRGPDGSPLVWRDPSAGGYGFRDSFNLGTGWVAGDYVAIDQGPLVLAIENARTGRVWRWFGEHRWVRAGMGRLGLRKVGEK